MRETSLKISKYLAATVTFEKLRQSACGTLMRLSDKIPMSEISTNSNHDIESAQSDVLESEIF